MRITSIAITIASFLVHTTALQFSTKLLRSTVISSVTVLCLNCNSPVVQPVEAIPAIEGAIRAMNSPSYSNNAKNMQRMSEGDYSMGSKDISMSDAAIRRRVVKFCKDSKFRNALGVTERECNSKAIVSGEAKQMLSSFDEKSSK
jgi:hypothetical protein